LTRAPTVVYGPRMASKDTRAVVDRLVPCYAIVRRDNIEIFRALKAELEEPDVVEVIWDRRVSQRRQAPMDHQPERRRGERRGPPPEMWLSFGFVVAPQNPRAE
jgi:hypothetical protein